jgi:hypothetical protein
MFFGLQVPLVLFRTLIKNVGTNFQENKYNYKGIKGLFVHLSPEAEI